MRLNRILVHVGVGMVIFSFGLGLGLTWDNDISSPGEDVGIYASLALISIGTFCACIGGRVWRYNTGF